MWKAGGLECTHLLIGRGQERSPGIHAFFYIFLLWKLLFVRELEDQGFGVSSAIEEQHDFEQMTTFLRTFIFLYINITVWGKCHALWVTSGFVNIPPAGLLTL